MNWKIKKKSLARFTYALICCAFLACAQDSMSVSNGYNTANQYDKGLPSDGIAQGSIFVVRGQGLGPDQALWASFPLTTTLGGVSLTISAADGTDTQTLLAFVSSVELDAILPSSTPLGKATLTVNYAGSIVSMPIKVVRSAPKLFSDPGASSYDQASGQVVQNDFYHPARPGDVVTVTGTGLGPITADETQAFPDDGAKEPFTVLVGTRPAGSATTRRGDCCSEYPLSYTFAGLAGLDVIEFEVPQQADGCFVSVQIQQGKFLSNTMQIAVSKDGGPCEEVLSLNGGKPVYATSASTNTGRILMTRVESSPNLVKGDNAFVAIQPYQFDVGERVPFMFWLAVNSPGSCAVDGYTSGIHQPPYYGPAVVRTKTRLAESDPYPEFSAGPKLTIVAPGVVQDLAFTDYGFPVAVYTSGSDTGSFLPPGPYTLDNGAGGPDIGAFTLNLRNPFPVTWTNQADLKVIDRSQGLKVTWTGGNPEDVVTVSGVGTVDWKDSEYVTRFSCTALASAGELTVPAYITGQMLASQKHNLHTLSVSSITQSFVSISGVAVTAYYSETVVEALARFQ